SADEPSAYSAFGSAIAAEERRDDGVAERFYRRALELDPNLSSAYTNLGNVLYRRHEVPEARTCYERAVALDPDQVEARYNLAAVLAEMGEGELALAHYRRVVGGAPAFADGHFNLALELERRGTFDEARTHYARYLELGQGATEWMEAARSALARIGSSR